MQTATLQPVDISSMLHIPNGVSILLLFISSNVALSIIFNILNESGDKSLAEILFMKNISGSSNTSFSPKNERSLYKLIIAYASSNLLPYLLSMSINIYIKYIIKSTSSTLWMVSRISNTHIGCIVHILFMMFSQKHILDNTHI